MSRFLKKAVLVEAFRWAGGPDQTEEPDWIVLALNAGGVWIQDAGQPTVRLRIVTPEGVMTVMALAIITADQRRQQTTVKGQIWGKAGVGKTTLLKTLTRHHLSPSTSRAGLLAVERDDEFGPAWAARASRSRTGRKRRRSRRASKHRHPDFAWVKTVFIDSTTVASRMCFDWCKEQPEAFNKQGQKNNLGAYGLLGLEMVDWVKRWHHLPAQCVVGRRPRAQGNRRCQGLGPSAHRLEAGERAPLHHGLLPGHGRVQGRGRQHLYAGLFTDPLKNPEYANVPLKTRVRPRPVSSNRTLGRLMAKALKAPPPKQQHRRPAPLARNRAAMLPPHPQQTSEAA
jgi:hypothetical protein